MQHYQVDIYMKYDEIPFPQEKNQLIMEIIISTTSSKVAVQSLNRCRKHLGAMFLSDMVTADEKFLEQFLFESTLNGVNSRYKFPKEEATKANWIRWRKFWTDYGISGMRLKEELGNWKNPTHRTWRWFYN